MAAGGSWLRSRGALALLVVALSLAPHVAAQKGGASLWPPLNDDFARAQPLGLLLPRGAVHEQPTFSATEEPDEPAACGAGSTVWFTLGPFSAAGPVRLDTFGSGFDTVVAVYRGADLALLRPVACNDDADAGSLHSMTTFVALPGETYRVQVGGAEGAVGDLRLRAQPALPPLA